MKTCSPRFCHCLFGAMLLFLTVFQLHGQGSTPAGGGANLKQAELEPLLYLKATPLPLLQQKIRSSLGNFPGADQTENALKVLAVALGDPDWKTLDPEADINFILLNDLGRTDPFLLAVKLAKDSPIRQNAKKYQLQSVEAGEWVFFIRNPEFLRRITASKSIAGVLQKKRAADLELGLWTDRFSDQLLKNRDGLVKQLLLKNQDLQHNPDAIVNINSFITLFAKEFATMEACMAAVTFRPEQITLYSMVKARAGSSLQLLLGQKTGGEVPGARFLENSGFLQLVARTDPVAAQNYISTFLNRCLLVFQGELKQTAEKLSEINREVWKLSRGDIALTMDYQAGRDVLHQIFTLQSDFSGFKQLVERLHNQDFNEIFRQFKQMGGQDFRNETIIASDAYTVQEINVNIFEQSLIQSFKDQDMAEVESALADARSKKDTARAEALQRMIKRLEESPPRENKTTHSLHCALVGDQLISAPDRESIQPIIRLARENQAAANNLADALPLPEGTALRLSINLPELIKSFASKAETAQPDSAIRLKLAMHDLQLQPISLNVGVGDGRLVLRWDLPVETLTTVGRKIKEANQAATP